MPVPRNIINTSLSIMIQKTGLSSLPPLAETYGWFREGFDTQDLREAHALLAQLA